MPTAAVNGIDITYEVHGDPDDPPLVLINGLGSQLVRWPQGWIVALVERGLHVIVFDNRDVGLSSATPGTPPKLAEVTASLAAGEPPPVPYTVSDMAADTVGLLDHLGFERAHVLGMSMGGMIAQTVAIEHPERVASLTSVMSSTGDRSVGRSSPEALAMLMTRAPEGREAAIDHDTDAAKTWAGPHYDHDHLRALNETAYDRSHRPEAAAFQMAAITASGDRTERLGGVTAPTLVIHGRADTLIDVSGGEATAAAIPDAELLVLDDMGHDLFPPVWPRLADAVAAHVERTGTLRP